MLIRIYNSIFTGAVGYASAYPAYPVPSPLARRTLVPATIRNLHVSHVTCTHDTYPYELEQGMSNDDTEFDSKTHPTMLQSPTPTCIGIDDATLRATNCLGDYTKL